jgi:hypothetical protein
MLPILLAAFLAIAQAPHAEQEEYGSHGGMQEMTCPVGGEHFRALVTASYSIMGARPDGRPDTYWFMPLPIPECPSNGLVMFSDFTPAELAALAPLVASDAYRAMVRTDSTYYRAQWLATRIGRSEKVALGLLIPAIWQVKPTMSPTGQPMPSAAKARQYQEEFVARVRALPSEPADDGYLAPYLRAANAERELGHFDSAANMLRQVGAMLRAPRHADNRAFVAALTVVVARNDPSIYPLDMADEVRVPWLCMDDALPASAFNQEMCARPAVRARIEENRRLRARQQAQ